MRTRNKKKPARTISAGTKLTREQFASVQECAYKKGLDLSEYIRNVLLQAAERSAATEKIETLLRQQVVEIEGLRASILNLSVSLAARPRLKAYKASGSARG